MKKLIVIIIAMFQPFLCVGQKLFTYHVDQYGNASISLDKKKKQEVTGELVIPEFVGKKNEYRVWTIEDFSNCTNITSVVIPKQVYTIGRRAFNGCINLRSIKMSSSVHVIKSEAFAYCTNLQSIIIPNETTTIEDDVFKKCEHLESIKIPDKEPFRGTGLHNPIFIDCKNLAEVEGYSIKYPEWIDKEIIASSPIYKKLTELRSSFSYFTQDKLSSYILNWQKQKPVETVEQWKERVTESNREKKISEYLSSLQTEYIAKMDIGVKYTGRNCLLMEYDTDYNVYRVIFPNGKEGYLKVPVQDVNVFKEKFLYIDIIPTYGIVNDHFEMLSFYVELDGKRYESAKTYTNDGFEELVASLPPLSMNLANKNQDKDKGNKIIDNSIDINIPITPTRNNNTFAVIIGNENYAKVSKVQYALNDARSFAEYCKKTLGIPEKNVRGYEDATYGTIVSAIKDVQKIAEAYKGNINVIFYYAGHGIPDNASKDAFLLPIDADGRQIDICYSLSKLYEILGGMQTNNVTVFLDACFSGAVRGEGMLTAARGVAIKTNPAAPKGNMVVFSAATDEQTAFPYAEKGHGMFTYFLLKKIRETRGDVTLGELSNYIKDEVTKQAIVVNGRNQTPTISCSYIIQEKWKNIKLR